jgi:maltose-binding protein MalE
LTSANALYTDEFWTEQYPEVAKKAFTTGSRQVGYPIYLDTCMMIYDTSIAEKPSTFGSITDFAISFEDETNSRVLFRFDISDPYCDYLYLGSGAQIFGENGEDTSVFDVSNDAVVQNMTYYQSLHEYFSLDVSTSTYAQIKSELVDGTLVYGIVKTDVLSEISSYGSSYALCPVPVLSDELSVQDLSTTYGAFVSSYSTHSEYANLFAAYLSYEYADNIFSLSKRVAVRSTIEHSDSNESSVYEQYCQSVPAPKALENGDFWIYTEICFKNIWNGNDVAAEMEELQTQMNQRLN